MKRKNKTGKLNLSFVIGRFKITFKLSAGKTKDGNTLIPLLGIGWGKDACNMYLLGFSIMLSNDL